MAQFSGARFRPGNAPALQGHVTKQGGRKSCLVAGFNADVGGHFSQERSRLITHRPVEGIVMKACVDRRDRVDQPGDQPALETVAGRP